MSASKQGRVRQFVEARLDPRSYLGLHLTLGLAAAAIAIWAFSALLEEILETSAIVRWDIAVATQMRAAATPNGLRLASLVTNLGSPAAMTVLAAYGAAKLWRRHRVLALTWIGALVGGGVIDQLLKLAVHRARPGQVAFLVRSDSYSFPSGHAMLATVGLGMAAYVAQTTGRVRPVAGYTVAALLVLLVGTSRVYLGVHYPSDVLGGFIAGGAWLAVCLTGAQVARGRAGRGGK
jgi:undecaprenyl-diphosphatase